MTEQSEAARVRAEHWIENRLGVSGLYADAATAEARQARVRAIIITRDIEFAIAGKFGGANAETWGELYRRLYGEPLHGSAHAPT
jgi:hypothetical protein